MLKLENICVDVSYNIEKLYKIVSKLLKINENNVKNIEIIKKSIDARKKNNIKYVLSLKVELNDNLENNYENLKFNYDKTGLEYKKICHNIRPIIIGFGPAGMFAGLALSKMGLKPLIIEQGNCVEQRIVDVQEFWKNKKLNKFSNVQFGEGGAGTFSDGKLNTNVNNEYCKKVINELFIHGAPEDITYRAKPHIGSDKLVDVVRNIRNDILSMGGEILFANKLVDINIIDDKIKSIIVKDLKHNELCEYECEFLILAVGHSARDIFELLKQKNVQMKQKPFAMGVRIEHLQETINKSQYGESYDRNLPPAEYKLVEHLKNGRSVFSFCMCPGGQIVASSSNEDEIVTNGMSNYNRDGKNANSALLVNVTPNDYESDDCLAGIYFQQKYEKLAFLLGGGNFNAPCESIGEFLYNKKPNNVLDCSYKPGYTFADISKCLPDFVCESLKLALGLFDKKIKNFASSENILVAIESRSSCPLTVVRDDNYESNIRGIYPCGEGAGYAGGIISSAQDGIKIAEKIYDIIKK